MAHSNLNHNPRIYIFTLCVALLIFTLLSCGSEESTEPEIGDTPDVQEQLSEPEKEEPQDKDYSFKKSDALKKLPRVISVSIATRSGNTRDGFEAHAETDSEHLGESDLVYEWKLNDETLRAETGQALSWRDDFAKGDTLTVLVIPLSEYGEGVWQAEGSIVIPNSPPEITSVPGDLFESGEFRYTVEAMDPDGDDFDYTLRGAPEGMIIEPATGRISWEYGIEDSGEHEVIIVVTDSDGAQASQILTFSIYDQDDPSGTQP